MKKILLWIFVIVIVVIISVAYHNNSQNTNLENLVNNEDYNISDIINENNINVENENVNSEENADVKNNIVVSTLVSGEKKEETKNNIVVSTPSDEKNKNNEKMESSPKENSKLETMAGSYSSYSNSKCAWGFVRKSEGKQPEFYGPHAKVLDNNEGIYCGNNDEQVIYLTFDEGYENGYTAPILDTLKEKDVTAVFFVTMPYVKQNPDLVKRMIDEGHIVGNHIPV